MVHWDFYMDICNHFLITVIRDLETRCIVPIRDQSGFSLIVTYVQTYVAYNMKRNEYVVIIYVSICI